MDASRMALWPVRLSFCLCIVIGLTLRADQQTAERMIYGQRVGNIMKLLEMTQAEKGIEASVNAYRHVESMLKFHKRTGEFHHLVDFAFNDEKLTKPEYDSILSLSEQLDKERSIKEIRATLTDLIEGPKTPQ